MIYKDVNKETARKICKKYKARCKNCPLRRERTTKDGKDLLLFCAYILIDLNENDKYLTEETKPLIEEELNLLLNEEIKHEKELLKELNELQEKTPRKD